MRFTTAIVTALMVFSIYFIMFATPDGADMTRQGVVAAIVAVVGGAIAYAITRPRQKDSSQ
ncbi:hypothetical protein [Mycetocola reblochoni]|uniref:Uncharacterized protein n=2 Tax=Mycetocola reblochoni TaxID=331618 RepID=A0A1R4K7J0_9MICO|nr:hypothetical protein [Mycetocola reblochoni]RLP71109.1 hypothetical protein D9V30_01440 [Mycetocola reblochoni]SJN40154.1 hypothetical protein FM119_11810 [Mycetocola reblochoni REB411]